MEGTYKSTELYHPPQIVTKFTFPNPQFVRIWKTEFSKIELLHFEYHFILLLSVSKPFTTYHLNASSLQTVQQQQQQQQGSPTNKDKALNIGRSHKKTRGHSRYFHNTRLAINTNSLFIYLSIYHLSVYLSISHPDSAHIIFISFSASCKKYTHTLSLSFSFYLYTKSLFLSPTSEDRGG